MFFTNEKDVTITGNYLFECVNSLFILIKFLMKRSFFFRFSISIATYSLVATFVFLYQMNFKYEINDVLCTTNLTQITNYPKCFNVYGTVCRFLEIFVDMFLVSVIFARWALPHSSKLTNDRLYHQVSMLTSTAADVIDISDLMQDNAIIKYKSINDLLQKCFLLSILQFSFSVAATKQKSERHKRGFCKFIDSIFSTEAWSLMLALFTQELPCFIVRVILILNFEPKMSYSLYFFAIKNGIMVVLYACRSIVLVKQEMCPGHLDIGTCCL
jgi:hypothetical protein